MFNGTGLAITVNSERLEGVIGVNYSDERPHQVRIVRRIGDRIVSDDYDVSSIAIKLKGTKIDYRVPVICECPTYTGERIAGRVVCLSVASNGTVIVNYPINNGNLTLHISDFNVDKLRSIVERDKGTLYLELSEDGFGRIVDQTPSEDNIK